MKDIDYRLEKIRLKLKNPFNIAHGNSLFRESIIFTLSFKDYTGFGEAPIVPYYELKENNIIEEIKLNIEKLKKIDSPHELQILFKQFNFKSPFAECAFTTALFDVLARVDNKGYGEYIGVHAGTNTGSGIQTSYTVAYGTLDNMTEAMDKSPSEIVKIKIGFPDDMERLKSILKKLTGKVIRLDANQGWTLEETFKKIEFLNHLKEEYYKYGINFEMLEEPVKAGFSEIEKIAKMSAVPIFLDESVKSEKDLDEALNTAGDVSGIVVKTGKTGGPFKTLKLIRKARSKGFKVMIGGFIESSLGTTASAFLAPECDFADLDAPLLIENDPFCGITYEGSKVELPSKDKVGLGVSKCN